MAPPMIKNESETFYLFQSIFLVKKVLEEFTYGKTQNTLGQRTKQQQKIDESDSEKLATLFIATGACGLFVCIQLYADVECTDCLS